ncbi:hypothetical protein [Halanaerobium sp.]|uniref:hypothetical protein n=1 Tax=Halanaerobium sp. TaxID=1895664 RepID=UPI000DE6AE13|nr:hypothetical protein [Halanaerobium sp.]PUU90135.1 MAG: sodium/proline symporter [Halanaerobium sp.]PUU95594.1 MAG: sodium/proline symporter [Halanaerobium sp.]
MFPNIADSEKVFIEMIAAIFNPWLGAAFGPAVLFSLFSKKASWQSILAGMITGTVTLVIWKESGLGAQLYEIIPGFFVNIIVILIVNKFYAQQDDEILAEYEEVEKIYQRDI